MLEIYKITEALCSNVGHTAFASHNDVDAYPHVYGYSITVQKSKHAKYSGLLFVFYEIKPDIQAPNSTAQLVSKYFRRATCQQKAAVSAGNVFGGRGLITVSGQEQSWYIIEDKIWKLLSFVTMYRN